jgi:endothelin-converting enzyme
MDEDSIKKAGIKPLREILKEVMDMFPVNETVRSLSKSHGIEDLSDVIEYLQKLGVSALISTGVGADDKDPDTVVVQASPPYRIGLPAKDYYKDDAVVEKYESTLTLILESVFPDHGPAENISHQVVEFEKKLAAASPDAEDRDDVTVSLFGPPTYFLTN